MDDKLATKVMNQMDLCTRMIMQQNATLKKWDEYIRQWNMKEHVLNIRRHFPVLDIASPGLQYIRVGRPYDGGYIMVDDFADTRVIYSCGINDDVSWDLDMVSRCQAEIFMYDHTIDALPENHPRFHFFKTGITGTYDPSRPELESLPRLIEKNGHTDDWNIVLKMDIEGSEYHVFGEIDLDTMMRFSQIVLEFHFLTLRDLENQICFVLDKLNATHQAVHVHGNNCSPSIAYGGKVLPEVLEVTYIRKDRCQFKNSTRYFPAKIDMPNNPDDKDIDLGYWGTE